MSVSLPVTPLHAPPHLEIDMSGSASRPLERGLHDSPASFASSGDPHRQQEQPGRAPFDTASHSGTAKGESDAGSFIDRGAVADLASPSSSSPHPTLSSTQRIFSQLDTVKAIQARIALSHSRLERIPAIDTLAAAEQQPPLAAPPPPSSPPQAGTAKAGKDGGLGDRTKEQRERVAKAYEDSADQFARREEGVEGIMAQVRPSPRFWGLSPCPELTMDTYCSSASSQPPSRRSTRSPRPPSSLARPPRPPPRPSPPRSRPPRPPSSPRRPSPTPTPSAPRTSATAASKPCARPTALRGRARRSCTRCEAGRRGAGPPAPPAASRSSLSLYSTLGTCCSAGEAGKGATRARAAADRRSGDGRGGGERWASVRRNVRGPARERCRREESGCELAAVALGVAAALSPSLRCAGTSGVWLPRSLYSAQRSANAPLALQVPLLVLAAALDSGPSRPSAAFPPILVSARRHLLSSPSSLSSTSTSSRRAHALLVL